MEQSAAAPPQQAAAAAAKKKPTTLLDAYEVECIRRELQRLVLKHNQSAAGGDTVTAAPGAHSHGHNHNIGGGRHHHRVSSAKKATSANAKRVSPSPSPTLTTAPQPVHKPKKDSRRGVRLLGRHAVAICSGTVTLDASAAPVSGRGRRAMICSGGTTAPVTGGRGKQRVVALCSGTSTSTTTAPVGCIDVRRPPRGGLPVGGVEGLAWQHAH